MPDRKSNVLDDTEEISNRHRELFPNQPSRPAVPSHGGGMGLPAPPWIFMDPPNRLENVQGKQAEIILIYKGRKYGWLSSGGWFAIEG